MTAFRAPWRSCFILPQRFKISVGFKTEVYTSIFKTMHFNKAGSISYNRMGLTVVDGTS